MRPYPPEDRAATPPGLPNPPCIRAFRPHSIRAAPETVSAGQRGLVLCHGWERQRCDTRTLAWREKRAPETKPSPLRQGAGSRRSRSVHSERPSLLGVVRKRASDTPTRAAAAAALLTTLFEVQVLLQPRMYLEVRRIGIKRDLWIAVAPILVSTPAARSAPSRETDDAE